MGSVGMRDLCKRGHVRSLLLALSVGALAVGLAVSVAGCGSGDTTTTTNFALPDETTTSARPDKPTTTEAAAVDTSTTDTSVVADTTTSTAAAAEVTTTTEKLSTAEQRLPDGHIKAMGFIKKAWVQGGKRYISIDYAEMLTGQAAIDAAIAAGDIQPGEDLPNDYYIRNTNHDLREFEVSGAVAITTATWGDNTPDNPVTWDVFVSFWSATPPDADAAFLRDNPWWIERDGQTVIKIDEQYLP